METRILAALDSPARMEALFREDHAAFLEVFPTVLAAHPDSIVLQVWKARLDSLPEHEERLPSRRWSFRNILPVLVLTAVAGTILKLPAFIPSIFDEWFYNRELGLVFIVPLLVYFLLRNRSPRFALFVGLCAATALVYLSLLPGRGWDWESAYQFSKKYRAFSDALTTAEMHIPLFLWLLVGVAFAGARAWNSAAARMEFLRYNGELIIYTTILAIAGVVLSLLTMTLLDFADRHSFALSTWYQEYPMVYLLVSAPMIATVLIDRVIDKRRDIAPMIARIFTPLFLITTLAYLGIMLINQKTLSADRDYLVALNVLLIIVLGLLVFTIAERNPDSPPDVNDYLNLGLALVTTLLDALALFAALLRSTGDSYGLTPNRFTIIGINILVLLHLSGILAGYGRFIWAHKPFARVESWIAGYLPVYAAWALLVSVMLPALYWYK